MTAQERLETALLGAPVVLTREQVSRQAGLPVEEAHAIWSALGFPEVPAGQLAFTERDAEALRTVVGLRAAGVIEPDTLLVLARAMGQGLSRLAEAQVDVLRGQAAGLSLDEVVESATAAAEEVLPQLELLVVHVWRRQFAAATARTLVALQTVGLPVMVVGFVDLVGWTRTSRDRDAADLVRLLERFEAETALRVTAAGGRVVKTIGDEVMFVADSIAGAAEVALATVEAHAADEQLPEVRAGLALGPVISRLGDVFGEPVNLASRLTSEARPGSVLVDRQAAESLEGDPAYSLQTLKHRRVQGYGALRPALLRRASV